MEVKKTGDMRDVMITISSTRSLGGGYDGMELITEGKYALEGDRVRFSYMESELTGLEGTKTDFLVTPEEVIMSRRGTVTSQMVFRKGRKQHFAYETPFGTVTMGLDTHKVRHELGEHGGEMEIEYDIDLDRAIVSRNMFRINVRDKGN